MVTLLLGHIGMIDVAQPIWLKDHIDWATSMAFASINPTNPRTNPWNFGGNCSAFDGGWKTQFFWVGHFKKKFAKKKNIFASFPWKLVNIHRIARTGQNFDDYPGFQQTPGMPILLQHSVSHRLSAWKINPKF